MARTQQRFRVPVLSSVYSIQTCEAMDRVPQPRALVGQSGISNPYSAHAAERRKALQMLTGSGRTLCSDGVFREPAASETAQSQRRGLDPHEHAEGVDDNQLPLKSSRHKTPMRIMTRHGTIRSADQMFPSRPNVTLAQGGTRNRKDQATQTDPKPEDPLKPVRFRDLTLAQLEISERRFVCAERKPKISTRRPSLVRKLSDSMKSAVRRYGSIDRIKPSKFGSKRAHFQDSNGLQDVPVERTHARPFSFEHGTDHAHHGLAAVKPVSSASNYDREMPLPRFASEKTRAGVDRELKTSNETPSSSRVVRRKPRFSSLHNTNDGSSQAKVVGDPNRGTMFGDFIDAPENPKATSEKVALATSLPPLFMEGPYAHDRLVPEPLRIPSVRSAAPPARKESVKKWVDPSTRSWMPPEPRASYRRFKSEGQIDDGISVHDRSTHHSAPDHPYDTVGDIIDAYAQEPAPAPGEAQSAKQHLESRLYSPIQWRVPRVRDATPKETFVDTFNRGSHTSWVANRRTDSTDKSRPAWKFSEKCFNPYRFSDGLSELGEEGYKYI